LEKNGEIAGVWPYFLKKRGPWRYVAMPPLTRMMGPCFAPPWRDSRKYPAHLEALSAQLPTGLAAFEQDLHYDTQNWLPLYWRGFRQTTRYSYALDIRDLDAVWRDMAADYRNQKIPRAREAVQVYAGGSVLEFLRVHDASFRRQGLRPPVASPLLKNLDAALALRGQREMFFASDRQTAAIHAVGYLVWDARSAYVLLAGEEPALRQSGAGILLSWEMIRYAQQVLGLPTFDFLGSMLRPIERVRRQFGATQRPYLRVQRAWSPLFKIGKWITKSPIYLRFRSA
jgi:hypothetical protein